MNRFDYIEANNSDKEIKIGMSFETMGGHKATILKRLSKGEWMFRYLNPLTGKVTEGTHKTDVVLHQIAECKKPDSIVKITYE